MAAGKPKGETIFAYLHPYRKFAVKHISELAKIKYKVEAYVPGFSEDDKKKYTSETLSFVERKTYAEIKSKYACVIHQAGQGMCQNMAILGMGQIMIPSYPEGGINSTSVKALGIGFAIHPKEHERLNSYMLEKYIGEMLSESRITKIWETTKILRERKRPNIEQIILKAVEKYL